MGIATCLMQQYSSDGPWQVIRGQTERLEGLALRILQHPELVTPRRSQCMVCDELVRMV